MLRKSRKQLTIRFLHRTILFFTVFSAVLVFFYAFGNYQLFQDRTLIGILRLITTSGIATVLLCVVVIIMELFLFFTNRRRIYLSMLMVSVFCLCFGAAVAVGSSIIVLMSGGLS